MTENLEFMPMCMFFYSSETNSSTVIPGTCYIDYLQYNPMEFKATNQTHNVCCHTEHYVVTHCNMQFLRLEKSIKSKMAMQPMQHFSNPNGLFD